MFREGSVRLILIVGVSEDALEELVWKIREVIDSRGLSGKMATCQHLQLDVGVVKSLQVRFPEVLKTSRRLR